MQKKSEKLKPFYFKQFSIFHNNSTMKVGTDAILLAAWCDISNTKFILDVGTGSGIIALLLATRSKATVNAIELDKDSAIEAAINFKNFQGNRPFLFHQDFNIFTSNTLHKYDLVISNPPFFSNSLQPENESRKVARHTNTLSHHQLCKGVTSLLSKNGKFCLVLPYKITNSFIKTANKFNLHLHKQLIIYPKPNTQPNRINMEFRFDSTSTIISEEIEIRDIDGEHSHQYKNYVNNYLIKI